MFQLHKDLAEGDRPNILAFKSLERFSYAAI